MIENIKRYGVYGTIRLIIDIIISKIMFSNGALIRRPFYVRNQGTLNIGAGFLTGPGVIIDVIGKGAKLTIGDDVKLNHRVQIASALDVKIGDRVLMASNVYISDHSHGSYSGDIHTDPMVAPNDREIISNRVVIGDDCWLGQNVCILPGVTLGKSVVVGAGSVVTKDIPDNCIVVGVPAKVIKKFDLESKSWC
jgi:acetyltransferase-like isoleucine patch superfamily enzyme